MMPQAVKSYLIVLRSKGFVWLATRNEKYGNWLHVGREFRLENGGMWLCCIPRGLWPQDAVSQAEIEVCLVLGIGCFRMLYLCHIYAVVCLKNAKI